MDSKINNFAESEAKPHKFEVHSVPDLPTAADIRKKQEVRSPRRRLPGRIYNPNADPLATIYSECGMSSEELHTSMPDTSNTQTTQPQTDEEEEDHAQLRLLYHPPPPRPPDGGYGWVVVVASLLINLLVEGISFSFTVFYDVWYKEFGEGAGKTAWCGSLLAGFCLIAGPFASALANKYGCRRVTMGGSVLACSAFFISSFAGNLTVMLVTFGVLGGIGFGLMYLPAVIIVGLYFEKRRAFATGLAVCGTGLGTLLFPVFTPELIEYFRWRGALIIIAGIALHGVVLGALFRPPPRARPLRDDFYDPRNEPSYIIKCIQAEKQRVAHNSEHSLDNVIITRDNAIMSADADEVIHPRTLSFVMKLREAVYSSAVPPRTRTVSEQVGHTSVPDFSHPRRRLPNSMSVSGAPRKSLPTSAASASASPQLSPVPSLPRSNRAPFYSQYHIQSHTGDDLRRRALHNQSLSRLLSAPPEVQHRLEAELQRPLSRTDIFLSNAQIHPNPPATVLLPATPPATPSGSPVGSQMQSLLIVPGALNPTVLKGGAGGVGEGSSSVRDGLGEMLGTSMLHSLTFLVICFAGVFAMLGFFIPVLYLPSLIEHQLLLARFKAYWLIAMVGICNTLGRILIGLIADRAWANPVLINNTALLLAGAFTIIMPFCSTFVQLAVLSCLFGLCMAAFISLRSIIIVQLFGIEKLTNGFGLLLMFQGGATLTGTPAAGAVLDLTQNPACAFYIAGGLIMLSGLMGYPVLKLRMWELRNRPGWVTEPKKSTHHEDEEAPPVPSDSEESGDDDPETEPCLKEYPKATDSGYDTWANTPAPSESNQSTTNTNPSQQECSEASAPATQQLSSMNNSDSMRRPTKLEDIKSVSHSLASPDDSENVRRGSITSKRSSPTTPPTIDEVDEITPA